MGGRGPFFADVFQSGPVPRAPCPGGRGRPDDIPVSGRPHTERVSFEHVRLGESWSRSSAAGTRPSDGRDAELPTGEIEGHPRVPLP